jgi:hypothetical protein
MISFHSSLLPIRVITSGIRAPYLSRVCDMVSLKFDLPQLDYTTRFSSWQVKMTLILAQTSYLDDALDRFLERKPQQHRQMRKNGRIIRFGL